VLLLLLLLLLLKGGMGGGGTTDWLTDWLTEISVPPTHLSTPPPRTTTKELRQHTSLFGQDTPTETLRLESCVKELRRVVSHSQMAIEKAMHSQQAFWARCVL
jgi:hypothetical protein